MAYLVKRTYQRPAANIPFFTAVSPDKVAAISPTVNAYKADGRLLSETTTLSEDKLTLTYSALWASKEAYDTYKADSAMVAFWAERKAYNESKNITSSQTATEI